MSENKKVFFIVNKYSGTGYRDAIENKIISACISAGIEPAIDFTRQRGHATELTRAAIKNGFTKIFAVGGDGTVNEVAQGLIGTPAILGILPKGSGNGLARHLGIPMRFTSALDLIASTRTVRMDTISINGLLSINVSGIGFDGHVAARFGNNGRRGLHGYATLVLKEFRSFQEFGGRALIDGEEIQLHSFIVAVANASQFGNNARVAPHASVCDGVLDLCMIRKVSAIKAIGLVNRLFNGSISKSTQVVIRKGRKIALQLERAVDYHIDGEPQGTADEFKIEVMPSSLTVILPMKERSV
jgi:diacylglycerol kinase (ATP)